LLRNRESSIEICRAAAQFGQSEKLVSLGHCAAGAAHEQQSTYSDSGIFRFAVAGRPGAGRTVRGARRRNPREQARRQKLVQEPLSFARQLPPERTLLDIQHGGDKRGGNSARGSTCTDSGSRIDTANRFCRGCAATTTN